MLSANHSPHARTFNDFLDDVSSLRTDGEARAAREELDSSRNEVKEAREGERVAKELLNQELEQKGQQRELEPNACWAFFARRDFSWAAD